METIKKEAKRLIEKLDTERLEHPEQPIIINTTIDRLVDLLRAVTDIDLQPTIVPSIPFDKEGDILLIHFDRKTKISNINYTRIGKSFKKLGIKHASVIEGMDKCGFVILSEKGKTEIK